MTLAYEHNWVVFATCGFVLALVVSSARRMSWLPPLSR